MPTLETNSFSIEFPDSWNHGEAERGACINGPAGEQILLQSISIEGRDKVELIHNVKDALILNAKETMQSAIEDPSLEIVENLKHGTLKNGCSMTSLHLKSVNGDTVFSEYSIGGLTNLVYITFEAPTDRAESRVIVEQSIHHMIFEDNSPNKPWWKFW